ncbi:2-amino-4-hydroxy-6-hydroxymethyldihydropteridine diphosphokinase [Pseudooceanicola sp. 216_PA32_1]|uniref:2-amino-4-hydroxy-6-hydroxymethyldihydropteridine pyrophosphokinase n=1 Tax=Pseudooceanicola pacificus TaxID=2676438 RepID=A0A844W8F2_9RHOB|nr:2-amino-4-hydroxy-6-hydroxymethyldihydropteridine diphosphokinase [Pseudooceanicola pacificus]MWB76728.1 2-amino-4-hydroxy-6-hydroxymethyldihydropteridine diphosphokinase [Pseudooceanicola pacificus]
MRYLVAIGGNMPLDGMQPPDVVYEAALRLDSLGMSIAARSTVYRTPAFPPGSGPDFANAAVVAHSDSAPQAVLSILHQVEAEFSRERKKRWSGRTLDMDLLGADGQVLPDEATWRQWYTLPLDRQMQEAPGELILPHPRLQDRAFVLVPLCEVAPDWMHPVLGRSVSQMCADLPESDRLAVRIWGDPPCQ